LASFTSHSATPPELPTSGPWIEFEIDALALFLRSSETDNYSIKDEDGLDIFDRFAATEVRDPSLPFDERRGELTSRFLHSCFPEHSTNGFGVQTVLQGKEGFVR